MTIQKIKEVAYNLIENNQNDYSIRDDKEKLLYILAYNDGVNALARELELELNKEDDKKENQADDLQA